MPVIGAAPVRAVQTRIRERWESQANLSFFLCLLVVVAFVFPSLGIGTSDLPLYSDVTFTLVALSGVAIARGQPHLFASAVFVGAIAVMACWIASSTPSIPWLLTADASHIAFTLLLVIVLLNQVFRQGHVTHIRIQGAVAAYVLLGLGWAHVYHIVDILHPGSFSITNGSPLDIGDCLYFSFITLGTVGYGDITPVRQVARSLATSEALTGQLYLAILIARLVGMELVSWQARLGVDPETAVPPTSAVTHD